MTATAEPIAAAPPDEDYQTGLPLPDAPANIPANDLFDGEPFIGGGEAEGIAYRLIREESRYSHLRQVVIRVRWKRKGGSASGAPVFGAAVKAGGLVGHFGRCQFVIWLAADHCRTNQITNEALEGLVRHQLAHIQPDAATGELRIVGHEFEGFFEELTADGPVQPWLRAMVHRAQQLPLIPDEPAAWPMAGGATDEADADDEADA